MDLDQPIRLKGTDRKGKHVANVDLAHFIFRTLRKCMGPFFNFLVDPAKHPITSLK